MLRSQSATGLPQLVYAGTAAAPGLQIGQTDLGFYRSAANRIGVAASGLHWGLFAYQNVVGTNDGAVLSIGRSQAWDTGGQEAYIGTISWPSQTMTHGSAFVGMNIGIGNLTVTTSGTVTGHVGAVENDKIEISQTGGAVTLNRTWGLRVRVPIVKTSVTALNAWGVTFTPPNGSDVTGAITNAAMIYFPSVASPAVVPTNGWMGLQFGASYTAHLATDSGVDLKLAPASGRTVVITTLPTSSAGLASGALWNDTGTVKVA